MPPAEHALRRHDLVWLAPAAWDRILASGTGIGREPWLSRWAASDWPLVVRRRGPADAPRLIAVGLQLPLSAGRARIACAVSARDVVRSAPPALLAASIVAAPAGWGAVARAVLDVGREVAIVPRAFGSLAWAWLTGLDHIGPRSDLDLIWCLGEGQDPSALLRALLRLDRAGRLRLDRPARLRLDQPARLRLDQPARLRLDGEIVSFDGRAVHWAELASGAPEVLVKSLSGVALVSRSDFLAAPSPP